MFVYHPRTEWVDNRYPVFGPPIDWSKIDTAVIHYTAADDLIDGDPGEHAEDLPAYLRAIQKSYTINRGYSIGYLFAVDWLGGVWQLRGWEFKSAANAGHNDHTFPVLMLVDGADPATPSAVQATRNLIGDAEKVARRPFAIVGHGQLSGAATACPGVGLRLQVKAGMFTPQPEPDPLPVEDEPMIAIYTPPNGYPADSPWLCASGGSVRPAVAADVSWAHTNGVPVVQVTNPVEYSNLVKAAGLG